MNRKAHPWGGEPSRNQISESRYLRVLGIPLFSFCSLISALCFASSGAGTTGGNILTMGVGARPLAMGEAYTAQADDISSLYWNPAGLGLLNQSQASFMYNPSYTDMKFQNAAVALSIENGGIGGSLSYMSFGPIDGFDVNDQPTGSVNAHSSVGTLGAGWFGGPWAAGVNLKGVQATLADVSAIGMAADFGGIYTHQQPVFDGTLRLGAVLRNVGTGLKFIDEKDSFPLEGRLGAALVQMLDKKLNYSLDFGKQVGAPWAVYTGIEYWLFPAIALRTGYVGDGQEGNGLRLGIGLKIRDLSFDYAYSHYGDLGMAHRYELVYRFGPVRPMLTPEEREMLRKAKLAMAEGRYNEATLLFDSLITLEPSYKMFRKYMKVAMKGYEGQEHEMAKMDQPFHMNLYGTKDEKADPEMKELAGMLTQENAQDKAVAAANQPNPEQNALAPYVPAVEPVQGLNPTLSKQDKEVKKVISQEAIDSIKPEEEDKAISKSAPAPETTKDIQPEDNAGTAADPLLDPSIYNKPGGKP